MNQPRKPRRRAITLVLFALLPALLVSSGVAYADHQPNHNPSENAQPGVDITICHATGSATNPYVTITINPNGLNGHLNTPHSGTDIVPAPAGGCPGPVTPPPPTDVCPNIAGDQATVPAGLAIVDGQCVAPTTPTTPTTPDAPTPATPTPDAPTPDAPTPDAPTPTPDATPEATPDAAEADTPSAPAADDTTVAGAAEVPAGESTAGAAEAADGTLPFTGAPTWVLAIAGMVLMLAGSILHRHGSRRTVAVTTRN